MVIFASFNCTMHFECEITWTLDRIYSAYAAHMLVTIFWILSSKHRQRSRLQLFGCSRVLSTCNHHSLSFIRNSKIRIEIPKVFKSSATLITPRIWTGLLVLVPTNGAAGWIRSTLPWFSLIHCPCWKAPFIDRFRKQSKFECDVCHDVCLCLRSALSLPPDEHILVFISWYLIHFVRCVS